MKNKTIKQYFAEYLLKKGAITEKQNIKPQDRNIIRELEELL